MRERPEIWLCDLTYTQQTIASDVMPAAVGCIAAYVIRNLSREPAIRIFKFPERLAEALERDGAPRVIGFSNYVWNRDLASKFARLVKDMFPGVVTVMGGPNYPTAHDEREAFLRAHPMIDFYVEGEGERAFCNLVETLATRGFDPKRVPDDLPSVHRINARGEFKASEPIERIRDLSEVPSPYLMGLMDEFFDGVLTPIIQTNRGCPFRCTFCVEGSGYYSRVNKGTLGKLHDELEYVCSRMARLRDERGGRMDMFIADSNFGMYKEDLQVGEVFAEMQAKYGYPEYINVATGKNHKKRVLEVARIMNGAMRLAGSVQSLDEKVLENIQRANISTDELMGMALSASEIGANSYCEIILGLPGDSRKAHLDSIRAIVEADFNTVVLYQLMLLPGTDLASAESVRRWAMQTRYRVLPRCYGYFDCLGERIDAVEIERICVANDTMSLDDYLDCRRMHVIVNVFYNDGVFKEVHRLLRLCDLSSYEWLDRLWRYRGNARFDEFVSAFLRETVDELWEDPDELRRYACKRDNIKRYVRGELGANLVFKYKSLALVDYTDDFAAVARETFTQMCSDAGTDEEVVALGLELIEFARLRMSRIFTDPDATLTGVFRYDVDRFARTVQPEDVASYRLPRPREVRLRLTDDQKRTVRNFLGIFGSDVVGLSRIVSKIYVRRLFRVPDDAEAGPDLARGREIAAGEAGLTGLNQFT